MNGGLNCSILDGWWDEWFDGSNGWAISSVESEDDTAKRDALEAGSLFDLLEQQIVPLYYVRSEGPVPRRWMQRVKHVLASLGPKVTASRMVRDYVTRLYEPAAEQAQPHHRRRLRAGPGAGGLEAPGARRLGHRPRRGRVVRHRFGRAGHRPDGDASTSTSAPSPPTTSTCSSSTGRRAPVTS